MEDSLHVLERWWHSLVKSVMDFFFVGTAHLSMQLLIYQPVLQPLLRGHPLLLLSLAELVMVQQTSPPLCKWMHQEISQVLTLQLSARIRPQFLSNQIFKLQVRPQLACLYYLTSQHVSVSLEHFSKLSIQKCDVSSHYHYPVLHADLAPDCHIESKTSQPAHHHFRHLNHFRHLKSQNSLEKAWSYVGCLELQQNWKRLYAMTCA